MNDPNQALLQILQPGGLKNKLFTPTSRYYNIDTLTLETEDELTIVYLNRRFSPLPDNFTIIREHPVTQDERLDNITARYLGDPEQFWRICDANAALNPAEMTELGRTLLIAQPEGLAGSDNA